MSELTLNIHGRSYGIACDSGQEDRVRELGRYVDQKLTEVAAGGGASTEAHRLVLTALVMADEIRELNKQVVALQEGQAIGSPSEPSQEKEVPALRHLSEEDERHLAAAIEHMAGQIDSVTARLKEAA